MQRINLVEKEERNLKLLEEEEIREDC